MTDSPKPWARLVSLGSTEEIVHIAGNCFAIGRAAENDLSIPNNKLVSQNHCKISLEDDGSIYLTDSSTNGTQVDGTKVKQRKSELHHGDEIHIVFKKNSAQSNVAYVFEELDKKLADTLEATQEYEHGDVGDNIDSDEPAKKQMKLTGTAAAVLPADVAPGKADEIEETLLCSICQELLHDCVSLQPCMHTYCAGCFSQWMKTSKACPTCRKKALSVAQNHILRNLIEIYLKAHPDKQRPADELEVLNKQNAIKEPIVKLSGVRVEHNDYGDSDEYDDDDDDDDDEDEDYGGGGAAPFHLPMHVNVPVCAQCPGYLASRVRFGAINPPAADPANDPAAAGPAGFQCDPGTQRHIVCYCCMEMFPDRRNTPDVAPVACEVCSGLFCHLYWRCSRTDCRGCLTKLKDMNLADSALDNILLQNPTESNILKDYLQDKSLTVNDIVTEGCARLDRGELQLNNDFSCNFSGKNIKSDSVICNRCGVKALRQLAYVYRKDIAPTDLPDAVTRKENCYWGKNCRTQKRVPHAAKWNHICEQTRFTS